MFEIIKNMKYLKPILIIVAILLFFSAISFIMAWWKVIVVILGSYFLYKFFVSILK